MLFFITYEGKEYRVRIESRHNKHYATFQDEKEQVIDLHYYGNDCSYLENSQVFYANIAGNRTHYTVWRPSGNLSFVVESEYRRIVNMLRESDLGSENHVYAKMPGKIIRVLVAPGAEVEQGQTMLVMEAMKMENEIRAGHTGRISQVAVKEGETVETGTLLFELERMEG